MKTLFKNLFHSKSINFLSIQELKDLKVLEKKIEMSKNFRHYVSALNRKQSIWRKNNSF